MAETRVFDDLAEVYDMLISWKQRLRRERPFLTRVFEEFRVRRILDVACGTGMHAVAFHDWGYHVTGADISPGMVAKSIANAGCRKIEFFQAGFTELDRVGGMFDAVTCLGNSLPNVETDVELCKSLKSFYRALLPGGVLVLHQNNYDHILGRRERFMPLAHGKRDGRDYLFLRFFDFHDQLLTFNLVTLSKHRGEWHMACTSSRHRALTCDLLVNLLLQTGFLNVKTYGSFAGERFELLESDNLIIVAQKPHTLVSRPVGEPVSALDRIPICENSEPLVDIAEAIPGIHTKKDRMLARKSVVEMLNKAVSLLPDGYNLQIREAFRSLERQREIYERFYNELRKQHPDWPESQLRRQANRFLAPPDAKHPPGHTTGGAVDVTIVGPDGNELDMCSTIRSIADYHEVFPTYSKLITPHAAKNRQLLLDIMLEAGFSNYPGEWWHYSYGDSAWALRVGAPCALYGAVSPDA